MSFENACTRYATSGEEERFQFTSLSQKADIHGLSTIYAACSQLEIGEISEIIETQQGYYLLKITEKDKEQVMVYEEVKNRIRDILATEKLELYLQALRTEYSVGFASLCGTKFKSRKGSWSIMKRTLSGLLSLLIVLTLFTPFSIVLPKKMQLQAGSSIM